MNDLNTISHDAFFEEIANWELTLARECKKLKQLRKTTLNKLQANSIDISIIEIESELIRYKKIKDKSSDPSNKKQTSQQIVEEYTLLSRRFMAIMEKVSEAVEEDSYNTTLNLENTVLQQEKVETKKKHYEEQTFCHKVGQDAVRKKTKSCITSKKKILEIYKEKMQTKNANKTFDRISVANNTKKQAQSNLNKLQLEEEEDLWDIRYQLRQIKSMMVQMENEIKYHSHEEIEKEIDRIQHCSKKMAVELKNLRDDNQFVLARLQNIKQEINAEKKAQAKMIKQFEHSKEPRSSFHEISKSNLATEEVADWVKIRI